MKTCILLLLLILPISSALAETMYVKSPTADLKSSTDASATVLAQLSRGTRVDALETRGSWIRVNAAGKSGWVYQFRLSRSKPSSGDGLLAGLGGGGATAREGSTATSIRGLAPTSEKYAGRSKIGKEQVAMIKHMESVKATPVEIEAFLKEGKLGEYGETP